jgi:pimeloyl-ACP methyl ester carboxylesterase
VQTGQSFRDLDYPLETSFLDVDGIEVAYHEQGQGPITLVMVHGLGSYMPAWLNNIEGLKDQYRIIALDLPGYGRSSKANYHYSMDFFAAVVNRAIEELAPNDQVVLVGHSMGGQIAMTHALNYPGRAKALVLVSPAGLETFDKGEGGWLRDVVTAKLVKLTTPESIWRNLDHNFYDMPPEAEFMALDRIRVIGGADFADYAYANSRSVAAMIEGPVYDRLDQIKVPTLVIYGEEDWLIPNPILHGGYTVDVAEGGVARFPDAELVMIPKGGHMVQFERSQEVNQALDSFLDQEFK